MINKLISEVEGVFGLSAPTRRRKRTVRATTGRTRRTYAAPARRTKRKAKRSTRRSR